MFDEKTNRKIKRFLSFVIDTIILAFLWYICYLIFKKPDFFAVKAAMDEMAGTNSQEAVNKVLTTFNHEYWASLLIWFIYEVITTLIFSATIGKLVLKLKILPQREQKNILLFKLKLILRAVLKTAALVLFQGFPFFIAALTVLVGKGTESGFDKMVRTFVTEEPSRAE
jgi:ABC-type transport system involved in cytochrome c biogenesis permease subunit